MAEDIRLSSPASTLSYTYTQGDISLIRQTIESFDFFNNGFFVQPVLSGVRHLLVGQGHNSRSMMVVNGNEYDLGMPLPEGTVLDAILTLSEISDEWIAIDNDQRIKILEDQVEYTTGDVGFEWLVLDVLQEDGLDVTKTGTEQRLNIFMKTFDPRSPLMLVYAGTPEKADEAASLVKKLLETRGIENVYVKGRDSTYYDSYFQFPGIVEIDLRIDRPDKRQVFGYPESYGKNYEPWVVYGVPRESKSGTVITAQAKAQKVALFIETSENKQPTKEQTIQARISRAGIKASEGSGTEGWAKDSVRVTV